MNINEKTRVQALAYLKVGKKPREISELLEGISYSQVLTLRKQLEKAEIDNTLSSLFNLDELALESILDAAKSSLTIKGEIIPPNEIDESINNIGNGIAGLGKLETSFQDAADELAKQIKVAALVATEASTLVDLAEALAKLNTSFFAKGTNVQVNNINAETFQKYLRD